QPAPAVAQHRPRQPSFAGRDRRCARQDDPAQPAPHFSHDAHLAGPAAHGQPLQEGRLRRAPGMPAEGQAAGKEKHSLRALYLSILCTNLVHAQRRPPDPASAATAWRASRSLVCFLHFQPTYRMQTAMINEALQRLLIENLTTATLLLDARLRLQYMNPAAEMLLAVSGQRSHGQFISELFTESAEALAALRQAVDQAHPFTKREATLTSVSGQTLTVDYAVTPILTRRETLLLLEVLPRDRLLRISKEEAQLSNQETT